MSDASLSFTEGPLFQAVAGVRVAAHGGEPAAVHYQAVDMVVVGQVVGPVGLVSISNATNAAYIVNAFVIGLTAGDGVVVARFVGARDVTGQRRAYAATLAVALAVGGHRRAGRGVVARQPSRRTPCLRHRSKAPSATVVLCCGCAGPFLMNAAAAFPQGAGGDAHAASAGGRIGALVSVALDLVLDWDRRASAWWSAAWATVVAQSVAAVGALVVVRRRFPGEPGRRVF